nr:hypothetical protein [uncultured Clostridium sp.]
MLVNFRHEVTKKWLVRKNRNKPQQSGDARIFIFNIYFTLLIITLLFAFFWVNSIKKADAFRPVSLDEINDVKLENQAEDSQTPASLLVN